MSPERVEMLKNAANRFFLHEHFAKVRLGISIAL